MKTKILAAVLAVALMLAGCGGGTKTASTPPPTPTPTPEPEPEPVKGLPSDHTLVSGTIPAGEIRTILEADGTRTTVTCPAGGDPCMITVASDGTATFTGGSPAVGTAPIPEPPEPEPEPYSPVSSAHWIQEPPEGWAGPYQTDGSNDREFRETREEYEIYSRWKELRSTEVLGYYGLQSRPDGFMQPWFERHADTVQPGVEASWRGDFFGYAFRRQFDYTDEGWTAANDVEARFADTGTLADSEGTERPYATKISGDVQMRVRLTPGSSTTVNWQFYNSRTPTGDPFGVMVEPIRGNLSTLNMNHNYQYFPVNPDGTFSFTGTIPYTTRAQALAGGDIPAEAFEISGAFVGTEGHGVLGTIDSHRVVVIEPGNIPANRRIQTLGLRGAFGAKLTPDTP